MNQTDVLIIGCGIAGCTTALELGKQGFSVTLVTATREARDSSSFYAAKGIVYQGYDDTAQLFAEDIQRNGAGLSQPRAVEQLVTMGPQCVEEILIKELQVEFERTTDGHLAFNQGNGHSRPRILHFRDHTGKVIVDGLLRKLSEMDNVRLLTEHAAIELLTLERHSERPADIYKRPTCLGAACLDIASGEVKALMAKETVLATGGLGEVYRHTTNPPQARGDGLAMAARAGVRMMNLDLVQFHPTAFYLPNHGPFLFTEELRGQGARLLDAKGNEFLEHYHEAGENAPSHVVARAVYSEMLESGSDHLWLDVSGKGAEWIKERFPNVYDFCLTKGYDMTRRPLPVVPAAHYNCGGIVVDRVGQTSLQRLRAVGEVACTGVHGMRRLNGTSLLEGLVWGRACGEDIAKQITKFAYYSAPVRVPRFGSVASDSLLIKQHWRLLKETMWHYAGLIQERQRLLTGQRILAELEKEVDQLFETSQANADLIALRNGLAASQLLIRSALDRGAVSRTAPVESAELVMS